MLRLDSRFEFDGYGVAWGKIGVGPPLVMVHGFPWSAQVWRNIAPSLAERRTVYYFDMLGSGLSDKAADIRPQVQDDLLAALLDHWSLERPEIIGHDFGGLAALRAHFIRGCDFSRMTLFNAVGVLPSGSPFFSHVRQHEAVFSALPPYAHEALLRAYMQAAATAEIRPEALKIYCGPWLGAEGQAAFYRSIAQSELDAIEELQPLLAKPDFPVDMIWGMKDSFIPPSQGRQIADKLGARSFREIADAAHLVQEDAPAALLGCLMNGMM